MRFSKKGLSCERLYRGCEWGSADGCIVACLFTLSTFLCRANWRGGRCFLTLPRPSSPSFLFSRRLSEKLFNFPANPICAGRFQISCILIMAWFCRLMGFHVIVQGGVVEFKSNRVFSTFPRLLWGHICVVYIGIAEYFILNDMLRTKDEWFSRKYSTEYTWKLLFFNTSIGANRYSLKNYIKLLIGKRINNLEYTFILVFRSIVFKLNDIILNISLRNK